MKNNNTMTNKQVAVDIIRDLGGNRFIAMVGPKNMLAMENGMTMQFSSRNKLKAKWMKVTVTNDTYNVSFIREVKVKDVEMSKMFGKTYYDTNIETVKEYTGIYNDMLESIFSEATGFVTRF